MRQRTKNLVWMLLLLSLLVVSIIAAILLSGLPFS